MNTFIEWFIIGLVVVWTIAAGVFMGIIAAYHHLGL